MILENESLYFKELLNRSRIIPFYVNNELICFISYYITDEPEKFINRENPYIVLEDEPETGRICYIDQIWSNKNASKYSFEIWGRLISLLKSGFPQVNMIRWNRWKNDKLFVFIKKI